MYSIPQEMIDDFNKKMYEIQHGDSGTEGKHMDMDDLMLDTLEKLGFGEGVKTFIQTDKWYA